VSDDPILLVENLAIAFGGIAAVDDISLEARSGRILSIIGPNGAGKTTLFNLISGIYKPGAGSVYLRGEDVTGLRPERLARRGLSRTFQNLQIFFRMTAVENVMVGRHRHEKGSVLSHLLALPGVARQNDLSRDASIALLDRVGLSAYADRTAGDRAGCSAARRARCRLQRC
jgi:branched-chain amino acid transport system ATP-binding protein